MSEADNSLATETILKILAALPDESSRSTVLERVLEGRCRVCLGRRGTRECCRDSRGG